MSKFRLRSEETALADDPVEGVAEYGSVVGLVRRLGDEAVSRFIDDLSPFLDDVQHGKKDAAERLAAELHRSAIAAAIVLEAGGIDAFDQKVAEAREQGFPGKTPAEVLADLDALS